MQIFACLIEALGGRVPAAVSATDDNADAVDQFPEVALLRRLVTQPQPGAGKRKRASSEGGAQRTLLLLDELDVLVTKSQAVLYELFALPTHRGSRCVLVGAANTINLIENMLPRLRTSNCEPVLAHFPAYKHVQRIQVLRARIERLPWRVFEPSAVELCGRRAAASGDMRRALLAACAAVDNAVHKVNARAGADASTERRASGLVTIADMSEALSQILKSPAVDTIVALPRDHKTVLCAAVLLFRGTERKETTLGALHDAYVGLCRRLPGIDAVSALDFCTLCSALADDALIACSGSGRNKGLERSRRVTLCAKEEDVAEALHQSHLFEQVLNVHGGAAK